MRFLYLICRDSSASMLLVRVYCGDEGTADLEYVNIGRGLVTKN